MNSQINKILKDIEQKKGELIRAYEDLMQKYDFKWIRGKIKFSKDKILQNKKFKKHWIKSILWTQLRYLISGPFIYMMLIPVIFLDFCLLIYQQTCFRLYWIPLTKRKDYIMLDRKYLSYLNWFEKLNCIYCSYANGIFSYAVEIAWRTEKYRCPIKHAKKQSGGHNREKFFADYGDAEGFRKEFHNTKCFCKKN